MKINSNIDNRQKSIFLISLVIIIVFLKVILMIQDGRYFILGGDPIRHIGLSENILETEKMSYPNMDNNEYAVYIYYALFYHTFSAILSKITMLNITIIYNILPFIKMLLFFLILYSILGCLSFEKKYKLIISSIATIALSIPEASPHSYVYFVIFPMLIYFSIKYFQNPIKRHLLIISILSIVLATIHSASALYGAGVYSFFLILSLLLGKKKYHIVCLNLWFVVTFSWLLGYIFLYTPLVNTFWETFIHYWIVIYMLPSNMISFIQMMSTDYVVGSKILLLLLPIVLYFLIRFVIELNVFNYINKKSSKAISLVGFFILLIGLTTTGYLLLINILLSGSLLVFTYLKPSLPYFAVKIALEKIPHYLLYILPSNAFFISMTRPMNLTLTVFLFISLYYLIKKFKLKKQTYSSSFILLFSFIMPLCLSIVFSFSDSAFFNSIIPTRFIHYAYISLFVFSAYIIKPFFLMKKKYICILFILILFFSSTLNMRYTSDYGVNIIQNQGYRWLTDNTELTPNLKEMNYDVKGYYHISHFPLEYYFNTTSSIYGKVTLEKNENTYSPKAQIRFFSYDVIKNLDNIQWTSYNIGIYDDKIYANSKISFYREKGE